MMISSEMTHLNTPSQDQNLPKRFTTIQGQKLRYKSILSLGIMKAAASRNQEFSNLKFFVLMMRYCLSMMAKQVLQKIIYFLIRLKGVQTLPQNSKLNHLNAFNGALMALRIKMAQIYPMKIPSFQKSFKTVNSYKQRFLLHKMDQIFCNSKLYST